jgi:outer membrane protein OmpA-like peptidoglycan-associated protein
MSTPSFPPGSILQYEHGERERSLTSPGAAERKDWQTKPVLLLSDFAVGESHLKPLHEQELQKVVRELQLGMPCALAAVTSIEGYIDGVDTGAKPRLRQERAEAVLKYLQQVVPQATDFKPGLAHAAADGKYLDPANTTPAGRANNRGVRIELERAKLDPYFKVKEHPDTFNKKTNSCGVVAVEPWDRGDFNLGALTIKGRRSWAASVQPIWSREVIYYNWRLKPLVGTFFEISIHHTSNHEDLKENEHRQQTRSSDPFAAIGYHFAIDQNGTIFQGRPLEVMGSDNGAGLTPGPENDPDWGSIAIVLLANFEPGFFSKGDTPSAAMLKSLEDLVVYLKDTYHISILSKHKELNAIRKPPVTVCPGANMDKPIDDLRKKLGMTARPLPATTPAPTGTSTSTGS